MVNASPSHPGLRAPGVNRGLTIRAKGRIRVSEGFAAGLSAQPPRSVQVIRFENVGLRYGMGPEVLRDVSFHLKERSFQFLSGPSGSGKTTLLRLLFMSLKPTPGLITIFGKDRSRITRQELPLMRRRIGFVFQDFRLLDHLSTYENVALPLRVRGRDE